jgi:Ca2+-binding RTX toxin-like protein
MSTPIKSGTEFLVNTTTQQGQGSPDVTPLPDGRFVVVWEDLSQTGGDVSGNAVKAQIFNADGSKRGGEFLMNTTTANGQYQPAVTVLSDGRFAVAWTDNSVNSDDNSEMSVRTQVFNIDGSKNGSERLVNTTTAANQFDPSITALNAGVYVVVWTDGSQSAPDGNGNAVRGQLFGADGNKLGNEFLVNTTVASHQYEPTVSLLTDGRFVVAWRDNSETADDTSYSAVRAQVFNADGSKSGVEFLVNSATFREQYQPTVAPLAGGRFVVAWTDVSRTGSDTSDQAIRAQVFNADTSKSGAEFVVNTITSGNQITPHVSPLLDGRFVVTWGDGSNSPDDLGSVTGSAVRAQVFLPDGSKGGEEFLVNTTTLGSQVEPRGTPLADGRFVIVWEDRSNSPDDPSGFAAVRAQVFDPRLTGVSLSGTALGDSWVGTAFDDHMQGLVGTDLLDGGDGTDTASFAEKTAVVIVALNGATPVNVMVGGVVEDTIRNIENIFGGFAADLLTGDDRANLFRGGDGPDVLVMLGGTDTAHGEGGNDYLYMGEGNDSALGGAGIDVLLLEGGDDTAFGGDDQDYLFGGTGNDVLHGEAGVDVLIGEGGSDTLYGGDGGDYLYGGADGDTGYGGADNDIFVMEMGNDVAFGEAGQDYFYMGEGDDTADGGEGVDVFLGGEGNDVFEGGAGGVDYAWGEAGNDAFVIRASSGVLVVQDFAAGGAEDQVRLAADTGLASFVMVLAAATYFDAMNTTIVTVDADTAIWLVGVNSVQLTAADFAFV